MSEPCHEMTVEKDVRIPMDDGVVLRANVYRPTVEGRFPVVMAQGVYGKDTHFADAFSAQYEKLIKLYPGLCEDGSTGRYLRWETVDPERWVPDGFVVIQVDSRGTGNSPGFLDPRSPREMRDYHDCIEWAGAQPWSNGRVGLIGISYYAMTQWMVAALQPPHLAAIVPWEGLSDFYRDSTRQGGIYGNGFSEAWWPRQVTVNQHGNGSTRYRDRDTGRPPTGPALTETMLAGNRRDFIADLRGHTLADAWYAERTPDLSRVRVPLLSAGNWGGPGMHLRGNIEGYLRAAAPQKWLSMHVGTHYESFYLPHYVALQKRFFGHFLRGDDNGWERSAPVQLAIRQVDGTAVEREEQEFPLARTKYTPFPLDADARSLATALPSAVSSVTFDAFGEGISFSTPPFEVETEITGFVALRLFVSSSTADMDIFATLRVFDPRDEEVIFVGAHEPTPLARGWLRASHRKLDPARSLPFRVFHAHNEVQKLTLGEVYAIDVEIWPTCIVMKPGYRLVLTLMGEDYQVPGIPGRLLHEDPNDRNPAEFGGRNTIHTGRAYPSTLMLPIIPAP